MFFLGNEKMLVKVFNYSRNTSFPILLLLPCIYIQLIYKSFASIFFYFFFFFLSQEEKNCLKLIFPMRFIDLRLDVREKVLGSRYKQEVFA